MKNEKCVEIVEVKELKVFAEPHEMYVWNEHLDNEPVKRCVCAIIPYRSAGSVITTSGAYDHCAEIPENPAPRIATNRELARWLAQGNGEINIHNTEIHNYLIYTEENENSESDDEIFKVRKWSDTEWHTPNVQYLGIEE